MRFYKWFYMGILMFSIFSCEEVIEVDLQESEPRLVVESSIIWEKGTLGNNQFISLSKTTSFYDTEITPAQGAIINIKTANEETFDFIEISPGIYRNETFKPELNKTYTLFINYENEIYTASEKMIPVVDLESVEQGIRSGISEDEIELKAYYTDPVETKNYYLFKFKFDQESLQIYDDEFTNGNRTFAYFSDEDLQTGDQVNFTIQGISKRFYEFLFILSAQAGENNGGPFQTQPTTVRGNIVNNSNNENFAFGYFRLSQSNTLTYQIE